MTHPKIKSLKTHKLNIFSGVCKVVRDFFVIQAGIIAAFYPSGHHQVAAFPAPTVNGTGKAKR